MTPPCTCGQQATGLVVEGHLHPYCAWQAERARAERLRGFLDKINAAKLLVLADWFDLKDDEKGFTGPREVQRDLRTYAYAVVQAKSEDDNALAADREGRSS